MDILKNWKPFNSEKVSDLMNKTISSDFLFNIKEKSGFGYDGLDLKTEYIYNNDGFRSKNFTKNADLVALGCSFTFGLGVPYDRIWHSICGKELNLSVDNLGICGASVRKSVMTFMTYCQIYGIPKTVFALFPEMNRYAYFGYNYYAYDSFAPKYAKAPYKVEDVFSEEMAAWDSLTMCYVLECFCNSNGIRLIWSSWDALFNIKAKKENDDFKIYPNFIDTNENAKYNVGFADLSVCIEYPKERTCHSELKNIYPDIFEKGGDIERGKKYAHWGVHQHQHYAEDFINAYLGY